uniref:High affinity immunoglobulin alpha and immunoglobulin mu Fc receptor n=2 Tax=Callithrix jacchus TaxID=9483 RepID=F7BC68_CALJA
MVLPTNPELQAGKWVPGLESYRGSFTSSEHRTLKGHQQEGGMENAFLPHTVPATRFFFRPSTKKTPSQMAVGGLSPLQDPSPGHGNIYAFFTPLLAGGELLRRLYGKHDAGICLASAANALKGPRLVSGNPGGAVTIQCHYAPSSVNRHQRKYWCRLGPPRWICQTIVSTNHYIHHGYRDRVALTDFPQRGLFVVRLSQLSPEDIGCYLCGIGDENNMLFFSMNLTVSAGPSSTLPTAIPAAGELPTRSYGTAFPAANRWNPGTTQTLGQGTAWGTVASAPGTSMTRASAEGRQTSGATRPAAPGTGSRAEASAKALAPIPDSPASESRSMSNTTEGVWGGTRSSMTNKARASKDGREMTTTKVDRPREDTERVSIALEAAKKALGTISPPAPVLETLAWEILPQCCLETSVSKQQSLGPIGETTPAAGVWTLGTTSIEAASGEGSAAGDLDAATGDRGSQATPSQALAVGPWRPPDKESSVKSAFPEDESSSRTLAPVSTLLVLFMLMALVLLQRKLGRRRTSQEAERVTLIQMTRVLEVNLQPDQLPHMERKMLQGDSPSAGTSLTAPERNPGP